MAEQQDKQNKYKQNNAATTIYNYYNYYITIGASNADMIKAAAVGAVVGAVAGIYP